MNERFTDVQADMLPLINLINRARQLTQTLFQPRHVIVKLLTITQRHKLQRFSTSADDKSFYAVSLAVETFKLKTGTSVFSVLTNVHTNFGFSMSFCFQVIEIEKFLNSYKARITAGVTDVCPDCGVAPHSVEHLFQCPACPTKLTTENLWDAVADFLKLDDN